VRAGRILAEAPGRSRSRYPSTAQPELDRNGLVVPQAQRHKRKYKRWQWETPMALWQVDLIGGIYLTDGRECKLLSGIDDHSRFVVCAAVLAVPSGRAVADAFTAAVRTYAVPSEALTDIQRHAVHRPVHQAPLRPRCRPGGSAASMASPPPSSPAPYSPTTTREGGAVAPDAARRAARCVRLFRRPALSPCRDHRLGARLQPLPAAPVLDMAAPASLFRPGVSPDREAAAAAGPVPQLVLSPSCGAVEFETVISRVSLIEEAPSNQEAQLTWAPDGCQGRSGRLTCAATAAWRHFMY
jgi:hypothetical protein